MAKPNFEDTQPFDEPSKKPDFYSTRPAMEDGEMPKRDVDLSEADKAETIIRSTLKGFTPFGVSEPLISALNASASQLIDAGFDSENVSEAIKRVTSTEEFRKKFNEDVERRKKMVESMPGVSTGAEVGGALASMAVPAVGIGKLISGISKVTQKGTEKAAEKVLGKAAETGLGKITKGAITGATSAGVEFAGREATLGKTGFISEQEKLTPEEAATSGAITGAALSSIPVAGQVLKKGGIKALSALGSVKEKAIEKYLQRVTPLEPISLPDLKNKVDAAAEQIQSTVSAFRFETAKKINSAVQKLKNKIKADSAFSYSILLNATKENEKQLALFPGLEKKQISLVDFVRDIDKQIADQASENGVVIGPVRKSTVKALQELKADFLPSIEAGDQNVSLAMGKDMLQALDNITEYSKNSGEWNSDLDAALQTIRGRLNERLGLASPEYADHMKKVSQQVNLIKQVKDYFGDDAIALANMKKLELESDERVLQLANQLEEVTGVKFFDDIRRMKKYQTIENLTPKNTESFLKSVMSEGSIENKKTLQRLSVESNENLFKLAEDAALSEEFSALASNGPRGPLFWQSLLGGIPSVQTALGAMGGLAIGGDPKSVMAGMATGYLVKTLGPTVTKQILDGIIKVKGIPTVQKINQAFSEVPEGVKKDLVNGFIRANAIRLSGDPEREIKFEDENLSEITKEIQSSNLSSIAKVKAINSLNKNKSIKAAVIRELMLGKEDDSVSKRLIEKNIKPTQQKNIGIDKPTKLEELKEKQWPH